MTKPAWKAPPVHPAAARLPMMNSGELEELAADIKAHGLQEPIVIWRDNREAPKGAKGPYPEFLLDGRNRLEALARIGIADPRHAPRARRGLSQPVRYVTALVEHTAGGVSTWAPDTDPATYVRSANVHRRHLTTAQKAEYIREAIEDEPTASNRKIARDLKVDDKTVAKVRAEGAANAEVPQMPHRPAERVAVALREDPAQSNRALAKALGVGEKTVRRVRTELGIDKPKPAPKPRKDTSVPGSTTRKRRDVDGAQTALLELLAQFDKQTLKKAWASLDLNK